MPTTDKVVPNRATAEFLSIEEAAELLRVSKATIKRYLGLKTLRKYKFGRRTLLSYDDVVSHVRQAD
jgi:excisionase family DNA binding protein